MQIRLDSIIRTSSGIFTVVDIDEKNGELIYDIKDENGNVEWCYAFSVRQVIKY